MKTISSIILLCFSIIECNAQEFVIPERTPAQKHQRAVVLAHGGLIASITLSKQSGVTPYDYGRATGDIHKTGWDKEAGFKGFAIGTIANWENLRREQDPPIEITEQNDNSVVFKVKMNFSGLFAQGPVYNVTREEYCEFFSGLHESIAAHLAASYKQEALPEGWVQITIARVNP